MDNTPKWLLTDEEKNSFISVLTPNLLLLRTQAEISQEELAALIGISRQTYSAMERKVRRMAWSTYLALVLFYDYNRKTHQMIRSLAIFPQTLINRFNDGESFLTAQMDEFLGDSVKGILLQLDEQALRSIRTLLMVEYARCANLSGEAVVKSFGGINFNIPLAQDKDIIAQNAIRAIKEHRKQHDD